jgi:hypothetical protein
MFLMIYKLILYSQYSLSFNRSQIHTAHKANMSRYIVFIAMYLSIVVLSRKGIKEAFLTVLIPFFLFMPFMFWVNIPGLPDPNFMQAAILPILYILIRDYKSKFKFGRMEFLLAIYVIIRVFNDFLGRGYSDAQNYLFYMLSTLIGPYMIGKYLIDSKSMDIKTAKIFVLMFIFMFPMFLYEAKFWVNPIFQLLSGFFPDAWSGLSVRWGLARTAGTFEHPILACIMVITIYRIHRWLCWTGEWEKPKTGIWNVLDKISLFIPVPFKYRISIALILMALLTISRGPWIGGFAGAALASIGNFKNKKLWLAILVLGFIAGGIGGKIAIEAYTTPTEGEALSYEAQTMLYRSVMLDKYNGFLEEKYFTGWGLTTVPKVRGMESVDNAYFLMALQHGVLAPACFVVIFAYAIISQMKFAIKSPIGQIPLGFTFCGIYLICFFSFSTVYMGVQTEPMLFLLLGWGESIKNRPPEPIENSNIKIVTAVSNQSFKHVIR